MQMSPIITTGLKSNYDGSQKRCEVSIRIASRLKNCDEPQIELQRVGISPPGIKSTNSGTFQWQVNVHYIGFKKYK